MKVEPNVRDPSDARWYVFELLGVGGRLRYARASYAGQDAQDMATAKGLSIEAAGGRALLVVPATFYGYHRPHGGVAAKAEMAGKDTP
jgi:hypothetical protein